MDKGKDTNSLKQMGFLTDNYIKFPSLGPCVFRLEDLVACFYTKKYLCQDGGYDSALIAYITDPRVISDHFFSYEGKEYDAVKNPEEVIQLHKQVYGKL